MNNSPLIPITRTSKIWHESGPVDSNIADSVNNSVLREQNLPKFLKEVKKSSSAIIELRKLCKCLNVEQTGTAVVLKDRIGAELGLNPARINEDNKSCSIFKDTVTRVWTVSFFKASLSCQIFYACARLVKWAIYVFF